MRIYISHHLAELLQRPPAVIRRESPEPQVTVSKAPEPKAPAKETISKAMLERLRQHFDQQAAESEAGLKAVAVLKDQGAEKVYLPTKVPDFDAEGQFIGYRTEMSAERWFAGEVVYEDGEIKRLRDNRRRRG